NPYGAIARIDGFPFTNVIMPAGTQLNKVLTIEKGPGAVYNYDSLLFIVYPPCQFDGGVNYNSDLQDSIYISAHFIPSCTDVELISPELSWVANNSNNNILTTRISGYNINYFDLEELILEYKPASSSAWNPIKRFYLETTDPSLDLIPTNPNYAEYLWELPPTDGAYDLRARSKCLLSEKNSPIYSGVIDRINPHPFGTPSPADGILSPEDDISIQFNEPIDLGSLTVQNFDLRGVLNNTSIRPSASLLFDGVDDYLEVTVGANLSNRDFTLQMAVKRAEAGVDEALLSQGQSAASQVYLGFNAANQLVFRINDQEVASTQTFNDTEWHNIALSYDAENETADMYLSDAVTTATEINTGDNSILSQYTGNNRLIIGKQDFGTPNAFHGNMQELRIWDKALNLSEFSSTNNTILSGSEAGLLYNWRMDEVEGTFAKDHVRNRDAVIHEAAWDVDPSGAAASFNGTSNKIKINQVNDVSITKEMNFTFELWFRGSGANPEVLFSNGSGSSTLSDSLTSWVLQKDNAGKLHFLNDGIDFLISNENYFDGQWHHLAVVMNRDANISAIVDGNPKNSIPATAFQQFAGVSMHLGAHVYAGLTGPLETAYFSGEIDEFRFWNTNRKLEQVKRDRLNRMQGNEPGLLVYLPFESYVQDPAGPAILTPGFSEQIQPTLHTLEANGTTLVSETPTIKIQRPIEQVSFTYSVNNDKIIITPTSDPERLENVTIDITVKGVKDLRGNTMASPATWIAYINKNQVIWQDDNFNIEKAVGESVNFSSTILNQGGAAKSFTLQNMPTWLSASPSSGIVPANASLPVTFTIDPLVNIGDYAQDVQLLTDFNYPEKLTLNLKVRETAPDFTVNAAAFQNSMGIIGTLEIGNIPSTDTEDILVAYVGNQVRGSNNLAYNSSLDRYLVNLDVYSNTTSGETLQFKIWDASTGTLYSNVSPSDIVFSANQLIGTPQAPQLFATDFEIEEPLALNAGWNWLGYYLQNSDSTNFDLLFSNLNTQSGNQVNGQTSFAQQSSTSGWVGPLETEGIMPKNLYKFYSTTNDTLMLQGDILDPTTRTINLVTGWNWIGFISLRNQGIAQALGNLNPLPGDQIKGRSQFAYYVNEALGWQGSLQTLVPGTGYMYKSNQNTSFTFPYAGRFKGNVANPKDFYLSQYKVNYGEFASNMNVILAPNDVCENGYDANDLAVVALDENGIARGVAALQDVSASNYAFLTINGESGMNLSLYFVNRSTGEKYDEVKQLAFESNALRGNIDAPEMLDLTSRVCLSEDGTPADQFSVYPTAFGQQINITYTAEAGDDEAFIGLYDITGREIISRTSALGEGSNNMVLDFSAAQVNAGSYMLVFKTNSKQLTKKLIKVN
ncbi:MAG: LamG-like jellyroll fold domain-containing protein, partial [Bacteroidia bacterium]